MHQKGWGCPKGDKGRATISNDHQNQTHQQKNRNDPLARIPK
jgi:hypothetical protein